jgi:hypothetical protein
MRNGHPRGVDEIQREIERVRTDLAQTMHALEESVQEKLDWRRPVRKRPLSFAIGAFAIGFAVGLARL